MSESLLERVRTGAWLDVQVFPPLSWAVPGLVPEGFGLFTGPPKAGKSWATLDLATMTAEARALWLDVYECGVRDGIDLGRRQRDDEMAAEWARMREHVHAMARRVPYDELAERRGEPERAARQRELLRRRGVVA